MTSFFTKSDIKIQDKIAPELYLKGALSNYNSVILKRQTRKFVPQTNGNYTSSSNSYISIKLNDHQDYLDAITAVLHFKCELGTLTGNNSFTQTFNDGICSIFDRAELYIAGVETERIENLSRLINMLVYNTIGQDFMDSNSAYMAGYWRWRKVYKNRFDGFAYDATDVDRTLTELAGTLANSNNFIVPCIDVNGAETRSQGSNEYSFPLSWMFSFFKIQQFICLPELKDIEIRLYLQTHLNATIETTAGGQGTIGWSPYRLQTTKANAVTAVERVFILSEVRVICDMLTLHPSYISGIKALSLSAEGLMFDFDSWISSQEQITATSQTFRIGRGVSHLKSVLCGIYRNINIAGASYTDSNHKGYVNHRFLIGSNPLHSSPVTGLNECYSELLKCFHAVGNVDYDSIIENEDMYKNYMFTIGQNFNTTSTEGISNVNTKIPGNELFLDLTLSGTLGADPDVADPAALLSATASATYVPLLVSFLNFNVVVKVSNGMVQVFK